MAERGVVVNLIANSKQFSTGLTRAEKQLDRFAKRMNRVGTDATLKITAPLTALGAVSVNMFASFENEMAKVKAVSGATNEQFIALEKNAANLGRTTKFTAGEMANLQLNLSKLGFKPEEIMQSTEAITNLAWATGEDLAQSATIAAGTLRGFGLDASEMNRVTDVMAASFSSSALDLDKFQNSMDKVAPIANALGISLESTTAMLGSLMDANVEASTAGTMLRQMMLTATDDGFDFNTALEKIRNSTNQAETALEFFDTRAVATAIILANNREKVDELTKSYENSSGAAKRMTDVMKNTLSNSFAELQSAAEGLAIEFGKLLKPAVDAMANSLKNLAGYLTNLSAEQKKTILIIAGIAAAIGPVLLAISALSKGVILLMGGFKMLLSPVTLIIAAIAALGYAAYYVYDNWQAFKNSFLNIWTEIKNIVISSIANISSQLNSFLQLFGVDWMEGVSEGLMESVESSEKAEVKWKTLGETFKDLKSDISALLPSFTAVNNQVERAAINISKIPKNQTDTRVFEMQGRAEIQTNLPQIQEMDENIQQVIDSFYNLDEARAYVFDSIANSLAQGAESFKDYAKNTLNSIRKIIQGYIAQAIGAAVAKEIGSKGIWGLITAAATAGLVNTAMNSLIPQFAKGGLAYSPMLAMVGDNPNARQDPEIIAPLSKLKNIMGNTDINQKLQIEGVIKGQDIYLSQKNYTSKLNRIQ